MCVIYSEILTVDTNRCVETLGLVERDTKMCSRSDKVT